VTDADQALDFVYLVGMLMLVASALAVRRLPLGQGLKMAGAWIVIFALAFILFAVKDDLTAYGRGLLGWDRRAAATGAELRIRKSADGHFWADGQINGAAIRLLVDSGASVSSISRASADRAGMDYQGGFPVLVDTANGMITMRRGRAERLKIGPIVRSDIAVHVFEAGDGTAVLGMNFLSSLRSWGVEGEFLVLRA
jgi:aspartyl protease family protein